MQAQGSVLTNKYAEGYPGKRYYGGCEFVDVAETAGHRARQGLCSAPPTPMCSRTPAPRPTRRLMALLKPGDTVLGMSLAHGGHLTHGAKVNFSGKLYNAIQYGLDPVTGEIDYDEVERLAVEHKPKMIIAGFSAYSRIWTGTASATSPTRWAPTCWSTWPTWPVWWPPVSTPTRSRSPT
jgi:glycine hydroxymethyltransferase